MLGQTLGILRKHRQYIFFYLGGFPHEALHALTGALTKNYILSKYVSNSEKDEFFKRAAGFSKKGYVMCAGTQKVNSQKD